MTEYELQIRLMERADVIHDRVERRIPSRLRRMITAEDVLQEIWIGAFHSVPTFCADSPDSFDRWLAAIVRNKLVSCVRQARRFCRDGGRELGLTISDRSGSYFALYSQLRATGRTPSSEEGARDAVRAVQIALSALPADLQQVITLRHIEGRSNGEVAVVMNRTIGAVNSLMHRGMKKLRERLGSAGRYFSDTSSDPATSIHRAVNQDGSILRGSRHVPK